MKKGIWRVVCVSLFFNQIPRSDSRAVSSYVKQTHLNMTSAEDTTFGGFRESQGVSSGDEDLAVSKLEEMALLDGEEDPGAGPTRGQAGTMLTKVTSH